MSSKDLAVRGSTAVGAVIDYAEYAGQGFENQTRDDIAIPFISVLQALSPQIENMDGAKAGMLFNTVTEELIKGDQGILFIPAVTQHVYVEWVPRAKGGGFVAVHPLNSDVVARAKANSQEFGRYQTDAGNDLIETFYIYGVTCDDTDALGMAVIAFTSTKIKAYKKLNTKLLTHRVRLPNGQMITPPLFANLTRLTSVKEKNAKGEFYNFSFAPAKGVLADSLLPTNDARFMAAIECKKMVESGAARAAFESQGGTGDEEPKGENIPF